MVNDSTKKTMYMYDIYKHSHTPPSIRTEQNRTFIDLKSIYKGLLPKQHLKYKTKTVNYNQTTFVHIYCTCLKHMTP